MKQEFITTQEFKKRIVEICLKSGLKEFPTKRRDQLILLKSIVNVFDINSVYNEKEINVHLKNWLEQMNCFPTWDHLTLRRYLVDEQFLTRNQDGSSYRLNATSPSELEFDVEISKLSTTEIIFEARKRIAQKKAEYLQKQSCTK